MYIAPLQRHSRRMWDYVGHGDRMRLQEGDLALEALKTVLKVLTGDPSPGSLRHDGALLYLCLARAEFVRQMPSFDEWGLRPVSLRGPRENPIAVIAFPVAPSGPVSSVGAGRRAPPGAEGGDVERLMPRGAPEVASPEACSGAAASEESRPSAPEDGASKAPAISNEAAPGGVLQADSPCVEHPNAPSMPQADCRCQNRRISGRGSRTMRLGGW